MPLQGASGGLQVYRHGRGCFEALVGDFQGVMIWPAIDDSTTLHLNPVQCQFSKIAILLKS